MDKLQRYIIKALQDRQTFRRTLGLGSVSPKASNSHAAVFFDGGVNRDQPGSVSNHWVKTVFETNSSSTPIPEIGERSEMCDLFDRT